MSQTAFVKALGAYNAYVLKNGGAKLHKVVVNRLPARLEGLHRYIASEARSLYAKAVLLAAEAGVLLGYNDAAEIEVPAVSTPVPDPKKEQKPKPSSSSGPVTFARAMANRMKERLLPLHENEVHGSYTVEGKHPHSFHITCTRVDLYPTEESLVKDLATLGIKTKNMQGGTQWTSATRYYHFVLPAGVDKITKRLHSVLDGKKPTLTPATSDSDPAVAASKVIAALDALQKAAEKVRTAK